LKSILTHKFAETKTPSPVGTLEIDRAYRRC